MFCTPNYNVTTIGLNDISHIAEIYNSNPNFLLNHIGAESISENWVLEEYEEMQKSGFSTCMISNKKSNSPVGFIEFKLAEETYLSLIMINAKNKGKGIGKEIVQYFEEHAKNLGSKRIRIDVVANYSEAVLRFWLNSGFIAEKEIVLNWNGRELPALKMMKLLA